MDLNNNLCNFAQRKRRRKVWKRFFQIYILFFLTGILFPPLFQKELPDHTPTVPANQAAEDFLNTLRDCQQISLEECRGNPITRLFQDLLRLVAPLL